METSDYYTFDALYEFVSSVVENENPADAPRKYVETKFASRLWNSQYKNNPKERLSKNRDLIFAIGQLSEDSRKIKPVFGTNKTNDKERLQKAYHSLQNLYKYGNCETLRTLDFDTVQEFFRHLKRLKKFYLLKRIIPKYRRYAIGSSPIRPKELDKLIADAVVFGDDNDANIQELFRVEQHYDPQTEGSDGNSFYRRNIGNRNIVLETHHTDIRKLVVNFCNMSLGWPYEPMKVSKGCYFRRYSKCKIL